MASSGLAVLKRKVVLFWHIFHNLEMLSHYFLRHHIRVLIIILHNCILARNVMRNLFIFSGPRSSQKYTKMKHHFWTSTYRNDNLKLKHEKKKLKHVFVYNMVQRLNETKSALRCMRFLWQSIKFKREEK